MKYFKMLILVLIFTTLKSCAQSKLPIKEIDSEIGMEYRGKFVDNYIDAVKLGLDKQVQNPKRFYKKNAVYLFEVGGGCFAAYLDDISVTLKNNDVIFIDWAEPNEPCPEVGEVSATYGIIIIDKKKHPNFKKLKLKYYWEK